MRATVNANGIGYWICEFQFGKTASCEMGSFSPVRYWVDGPTDGSKPISISAAPPSLDYSDFKIWPLEPGTTYHYRIYVRNLDRSQEYYGANQSFTTLSARTNPTISANRPVALGYNAARVSSFIFSGGSSATVAVEYGLTSSYGNQVLWTGNVNLNTTQATSIDIPSLTPNTLYYYRWKAINSQGAISGLAGSFMTRTMPTVITSTATNIASDKATLCGNVNVNNSQLVSPGFEYGLTTSYGNNFSGVVTPSFISGTMPTEVTANLTGLLPNTTYHYRMFGRQVDIPTKTYGEDMTFTTHPVGNAPVIDGPFSASEVTTRSAMVRASSVTAGTADTTVSFQFGISTSYGQEAISPVSVPANSTQAPLIAVIEGLSRMARN